MQYSDIIFREEWTYENKDHDVHFKGGLIPGKLSFTKIGGRVDREDVPHIARCMHEVYESGLIDDSSIVRVVDFSEIRRLLKYVRREYASLLWKLNREHRCTPVVTYICGANTSERNQIRLYALFSRQRYEFVDRVDDAFERIHREVDLGEDLLHPFDQECVLEPNHLKELTTQVGALLFGRSIFQPSPEVSPDNPAKQIIDSLAVAQKDLNQLQDLEKISDSNIEDTFLQNRELIEFIPVQLWSLRDERTYGIVNKAYAEFHGLKSDEMSFRDLYDVFSKEMADEYLDCNRAVFETGRIVETEGWFPDKNGNRRFLNICKVPLIDEVGYVKSVVCSASDITDLKAAESDLLKTKGSYEDVFNSVTEAIYIMSPTGTFLNVNKGAERMYGYSRDEMVGKNPARVAAPGRNNLSAVAKVLERVFATGKAEEIEFWGMRKGGIPFPKAVIIQKGRYFGDEVIIATARDITEEFRSRKALQQAEEKYRMIVETTADIIVIVGPDKSILFANDSVLTMTGYEKAAVLGSSYDNFFSSEEIAKFEKQAERAISTGEVTRFQAQLICRAGHHLDVDMVVKSIDYDDAPAILVTIRDISERVRAEERYRYQFELRQFLMELSSTFINLPLGAVKPAIEQSLRKLGEFVGADRSYIFDYDFDRNICSNTFEHCREGIAAQIDSLGAVPLSGIPEWADQHSRGETIEILDVSALPAGGVREILEPQDIKSLLAVPLMEGAECVGFVGFDFVTGLHPSSDDEKAMIKVFAQMLVSVKQRLSTEETRLKLSKAIEQNPTSVLITDKDGVIEYVNPVMCTMTGYERDELIGKTPRVFKSGHHGEAMYQKMWETILGGDVWNGELLNKKKNGELFWENTIISPIVRDDGRTTHFVAVNEDITARRQMIEELQLAKEKAEEGDRLKSAFLANMSHEIRTPLNGIIGFASLLLEDTEPEDVRGYADIICRSGDHLLNIINDIIHISKLDAGHIKMIPDVCNVSSLLLELKTLYDEQVLKEKKRIEVILSAPSEEVWAITDMTRLRQILDNLLGNAVKFTQEGTIHFGCEMAGDSLLFHVRDTGIGIPIDKQELIFERFVQASTKTERMFGGTGLGLAISRACAELLGGHIWVESTVGKGSTFFFDISFRPCANPDYSFPREEGDMEFDGKHVLVVEDDDLSYRFLERICVPRGIRVTRAATGAQAIQFLREHGEVDLVLMDIQMPEMDGWDATRAIRKTHPQLPIIAQTAYSFENDEEKCLEAGCNDYLSKPITVERLIAFLARYL